MNKKPAILHRIVAFLMVLFCLFSFVSLSVTAEAPDNSDAHIVLLYSFFDKAVLFEKNAEVTIAPGATAKMMTALLAIEELSDLSRTVTLSKDLIAGAFKEIYASEFYYDASGRPAWPKLAVNFTNKTQFVYRINKGVLDVADDRTLNASMPDDSKRVPFTNMIYLGDGLSDVPCMKMMRAYGGQAIAVYQAANRKGVEQLLEQGRVDFIYPADYREGTELEITVKNIIRKMAASQQLADENASQLRRIRRR